MQQILLETAGLKWQEQSYDLATRLEDDSWAQTCLESKDIAETDVLVGLNIGSSQRHSAKRWPPRYFYELAKLCQEHHPEWKLLVLAGMEDTDAYEVIFGLNEAEPLSNIGFTGCGNTISQFISLIGRISLVISADTFGLHVALGLGKKAISPWGPQPENEIYGYDRERKISLGLDCAPCFAGRPEKCTNPNTLQCMMEISAPMIYQILEQELSQ
ncbi:MAG: glycosyltransferase family 9 protein [Minisyncoccota bacterium]